MEENRSRNGVIFLYIILVIVLVSTVLILFQLWSSVSLVVDRSTEGPTPTYTLWWRTPQIVTSTPTLSAARSTFSIEVRGTTPMPASDFLFGNAR
jgi:hypothetical protein